MFSKFNKRTYQQQMPYPNFQNPNVNTNYPTFDVPGYNNYDISRIDEEINELKREHNNFMKRLSKIENYLGIKSESEASNYHK